MSYQNPAFMIEHYASDLAATTAITEFGCTALSDASKRSLVDARQGAVASYTNTAANGGPVIDFGTPRAFNRCVVPQDHAGIAGESCGVRADDNAGMASPLIDGTVTPVAGQVADFEVGAINGLTERYWSFYTNSASAAIEISEVWLGTRNELSAAVAVGVDWSDEYRHEVAQRVFGGGLSTLEASPPRRVFTLTVRNVDATGPDWPILDEVIRDGRSHPFWYWPPDTDAGGPYLVTLEASAARRQEFPSPRTAIAYEVSLEMVESLA